MPHIIPADAPGQLVSFTYFLVFCFLFFPLFIAAIARDQNLKYYDDCRSLLVASVVTAGIASIYALTHKWEAFFLSPEMMIVATTLSLEIFLNYWFGAAEKVPKGWRRSITAAAFVITSFAAWRTYASVKGELASSPEEVSMGIGVLQSAIWIAGFLVSLVGKVRIAMSEHASVKAHKLGELPKPSKFRLLTFAPLGLSIFFTMVSGAALYVVPRFKAAPAAPAFKDYYDTLVALGPTVAGFWVLTASLFTLSAVGFTLRATAKDAASGRLSKQMAIREMCIAEILAFWNRMNELDLHRGLTDHVRVLRAFEKDPKTPDYGLYRRSLGDKWFGIFRIDPLALTELGAQACTEYVALSNHALNLVNRFTYVNQADQSTKNPKFWREYHEDSLQGLNELIKKSDRMLTAFGSDVTDVSQYKLKII